MTNAEKFRKIFKEFATEVWAFSEKDFLTWLNADYEESTIRNCFGCKYSKDNHNQAIEECHLCMWENQYTPTTKNDLGVDCIDRAELLKAIDTWDKFGCDADTKLVPYQDHYIPYIHYDDVIKCIKGMPSVTPQQLIYGKCNQCKYYEGVHNSQGHAPCSYHKIGGVMWNWYCSQFENEVEE